MDVTEFKARLMLSRMFDVKSEHAAGVTLACRMASDQDIQRAYIRHSAADGELIVAEIPGLQLEIALLVVVGWRGVTAEMIDPEGKQRGEVPFEPEFARYLLEANAALANEVSNEVINRRRERHEKRQANQKNSGRVSSSSAT